MNLDKKQKQTNESFSYKWKKRETYENKFFKQKTYKWLVKRYFGSEKEKRRFFKNLKGKKLLDAGCGSGFSAGILFGSYLNNLKYLGVDSSNSINTARQRFKELGLQGQFKKADIATMKLKDKFDVIFCEGVLHHCSNPFKAFKNLISHLKRGGIIMFYVYRGKAPIREFVDDCIREKLQPLNNDAAWKKLIPLAKLGKILGDLNIKIKLNEDIELLEIPKGEYDLQRFFYWFFIKMFYDKNLSLEEMNHINFDWYRPLNCYRFHPKDIEQWLKKLKLKKKRFLIEYAGITVVAKKL